MNITLVFHEAAAETGGACTAPRWWRRVSVIEVALIAGGAEPSALARDTVFAAVMIILNGIVGRCLGAPRRAGAR